MPITTTLDFLPAVFQTETNSKFLGATFDQLVTEPNVTAINGYIGRKFTPGWQGITSYIREPNKERADYQLEPTVVVKNSNTEEVEFYGTYPDLLQKLNFYGGNVANPNNTFRGEYYNYNPQVNVDTFVNYGQYFWVPDGPPAVNIFSGTTSSDKTFYVYPDSALGVYNLSGYQTVGNPDIVLVRGGSYDFVVDQTGKKFYIQSAPGLNVSDKQRQIFGVTNNGDDKGTVTFNVPLSSAQDNFVSMPVVQTIDFVTDLKFSEIDGITLSVLAQSGGLDGVTANTLIDGASIIFSTDSTTLSDWTSSNYGSGVPTVDRWKIWTVGLTPAGSDYIIDLTVGAAVPTDNKVVVGSGLNYANTEWFKNGTGYFSEIDPITAPVSTLYYQDSQVDTENGIIRLIENNTDGINVDSQVVGKKNYISPNEIIFTNGLKIKFDNTVIPESYRNKEYYVEGVGTAIVLVPVDEISVSAFISKSNYDPASVFAGASSATINETKNKITISTTADPVTGNVSYGVFPNAANSNYISSQDLVLDYPYRGGTNVQGTEVSNLLRQGTVGIGASGIPIYSAYNGWSVNGTSGTVWHYSAPAAKVNGQDSFGGFPDDSGVYHYHDSTFITADAWGNVSGYTDGYTESDGHSKLIGFAIDGYPIYGPYGYRNAGDSNSGVERMSSGYTITAGTTGRPESRDITVVANTVVGSTVTVSSTFGVNPGMRLTFSSNSEIDSSGIYWVIGNGNNTAIGPDEYQNGSNQITLNANIEIYANTVIRLEYLPGIFIEDYEFSPGTGSLDSHNGRFGVTPDFPQGTYAYFTTQNETDTPVYPYVVGQTFYGSLDLASASSLTTPDYVVIDRSSLDRNAWSRGNRWFHERILQVTSLYNNIPLTSIATLGRATRPIIQFNSDIQLYDFGATGIAPVDIYDKQMSNPFTSVVGVEGVFLDGVNVVEGMRIIFSVASDPDVASKIYQVSFVDVDGLDSTANVIHLTEVYTSQLNDTVAILNGVTGVGKTFWYTGSDWNEGQSKNSLNQAPLFEIFDKDGVALSDRTVYPVANNQLSFNGTKIFSYKQGNGTADSVLGFPLSYKNIGNQGDIEFENNYDADTFVYRTAVTETTQKINTGLLKKNNADGTFTNLNVWQVAVEDNKQYLNFGYEFDGLTNNFRIDVAPAANTSVPNLQVYVNFKLINNTDFQVIVLPNNHRMITVRPSLVKQGDKIDILVYSNQISSVGSYQIPDNLNFNTQNEVFTSLTLGEFRNHLAMMTRSTTEFSGSLPGISNLRDIEVTDHRGAIVQQSAPISYASMFLTDDTYNFVDAIHNAQQEYTKFKNKFLTIAAQSGTIDTANPRTAVDAIVTQINQIKSTSFPWFYSDMIPYGDNKRTITYNVFDPASKIYQITNLFTNTELSNTAVSVYVNNNQLTFGKDYNFSTTIPAVIFEDSFALNVDDVISIYEYINTDGSWVPETPSKLGLYPKFAPEIIVDSTYSTQTSFIVGHDGSKTPIFGDFRDNLLLELEKRIYNNIKTTYSEDNLSIYDSKPGHFRDTGYTSAQYNKIISKNFLQWIGFNKLNYTSNTVYDQTDPFTWNYGQALDSEGNSLQGNWRACYEYYYDTQQPHLTPWEMLGFSQEPTWWQDRYGPAPYTGTNGILWNDLEAGYIADGSRQGYDLRFARTGLSRMIPVNEYGELLPPVGVLTSNYSTSTFQSNWSVGQWGPVETAWRNSSEWPYAQQIVMAITKPAKYFSLGIDTSDYRYDVSLSQYLMTSTNYRLLQTDLKVNGRNNIDSTVQRAAGYPNWIQDFQRTKGVITTDGLHHFLTDYTVQLSYRMASFSDKKMLKVLAEQNSPSSVNESIIIPDQDFNLVLGKSTPVRNIRYSGLIIKKTAAGYEVSGYDIFNPVFSILAPNRNGKYEDITVLSDSVKYWTEFNRYIVTVPYGTVISTLQEVTDLIVGYSQFLQLSGFVFGTYDETLAQLRDWKLSVTEFLFWKQQNWAVNSSIVLSPLSNSLSMNTGNATVDGIENTFYGTKVLDQNFKVLESNQYSVTRGQKQFTLTVDDTRSLIGYAEMNLVQYEHVLIFNNTTQFNDVIYSPSTGQRQFRLKLIGTKTADWDGSLSPQGYIFNSDVVPLWKSANDYLKGDLVEYKDFYYAASRNIPGAVEFDFTLWLPVAKDQIKTGLLSNFAKLAGQGKDFYNINKVNIESDTDLLGFGLIGFRPRNYFDNAGIDDISQVKFYQGYIKEKGTKNAMNAFGNVSFNNELSELEINEQWAFRVGAYGSLEVDQFAELVLDEDFTLSNPTSLLINSNNSVTYSSTYTSAAGLYKSEKIPFTSPYLLNRTDSSIRTDDIKTAGYVNIEDIDYTVFNINDLATFSGDINDIGQGKLLWVANDYTNGWNVDYVTSINCTTTEIQNNLNGFLNILTDKEHGLSVGDVIVLQSDISGLNTLGDSGYFNGFYRVYSTATANSFVILFNGDLNGFSRAAAVCPIFKLQSLKYDRATEILSFTPDNGWSVNSKAWINQNTITNNWAVYNKSEPWKATTTFNRGRVYENGNFGSSLKISTDNNFVIVGSPGVITGDSVGAIVNYQRNESGTLTEGRTISSRSIDTVDFGAVITSANNIIATAAPTSSSNGEGYVQIYSRDFSGVLTLSQVIASSNNSIRSFGTSIAMSQDYQWLYVGAPESDSVFVYAWFETGDDPVVDAISVPNAAVATFALTFTPAATELVTVSNSSVDFVPYRDYTITGDQLTFTSNAQPDDYVVRYQSGYINQSDSTQQGNASSLFGQSIACSTDGAQLVVGAPLDTISGATAAGSVTVYDRSIEKSIAFADQTIFGGIRPISALSKVYINDELQVNGIDYTIVFTTWLSFVTPPGAGNIVRIETNEFLPLQQLTASTPIADYQFGYSVDLCTYNCSLYAGSPYYNKNLSLGKHNTGAVYRNLNQGRIYGTITGTTLNPTVTSGDAIRINDFYIELVTTTLESVVSEINEANIPGVTAAAENGYLKINSDSTISADRLRILPGKGTALTDLGLNVFAETQIIENPTNFTNDLFGKVVKIDESSERLAVGSDVANTLVDTTFDLATTQLTLDADSTSFVDSIRAGAIWIMSHLEDSRNNISNPGKFAYVQQIKPNSVTGPAVLFSESMRFGAALDMFQGKLFAGAPGSNLVETNSGIVSQFNNDDLLYGWDVVRSEGQKVDINSLTKSYIYSVDSQTIISGLDFIDPAKGKILGVAEQDITYKVDYDPASYNNASIDTVSDNSSYFWGDKQVGQVWWDLSTVQYLDYEQGSILYRTANWGRVFPGSSIDVYEWIESDYPPSQYASTGQSGTPKYTENEAFVTLSYVDAQTQQTVVKYYYWVKDKTELTTNQFGRNIPVITIANYIRDPKNSGVRYFAAVRDDAISVYNVLDDIVGTDTVFHLDYKTQLNENVIHSEYGLVAETGSAKQKIPTQIYNKMLDSLSRSDVAGNPVPDPTLPVQNRYGIALRPRQGMFVDPGLAVKEMVSFVNTVFSTTLISQGYDFTNLNKIDPLPTASSGLYDRAVPSFEILTYINVNIIPTGFRVLVEVDEQVDNLWTIYTRQTDRSWKLTQVQTFRTTDYWQFIDWFAPGFDSNTRPTYTVQTLADLSTINTLQTGNTVKVLNNGQNQWVLVQVFANVVNTVGLQNGTIELLDSLWDLESFEMGWDNDLFDSQRFDQNPSLETRNIIQALSDDIFINELKKSLVDMFFVLVYYALTEQKSLDWAFKTSFIDLIQKTDGLTQPDIYAKDNQDIYNDYINEVKPYHTTVRDYIVDYIGNDNWTGYTTDFDVPAYYDSVLRQYRSPSGQFVQDAAALQELEYRDWLVNYPYSVVSVQVELAGSGYTSVPNVVISGSTLFNDAVARARVTNGVVTAIDLLYGGTNYIAQPVITISGGGGTGARAYARLGNNPVRKIKTTLIYDRLTYGSEIIEWTANTSYSQGDIIAYVGTAYQAVRDFTSGATFVGNDLTEYSAANFESANDRIQSYYNPGVGLPGKANRLLQTGIDYPGITVDGPAFTDAGGFDIGGFDFSPFDALSIDSDGTYTISDSLLDSKIESMFTDSSLGIRPEDIIVDGDNYLSNQVLEWAANTYYPQGTVIKSNSSYYITNIGVTTGSSFTTTDLMNYPLNPYTSFSSHAPEELVPGRVFDTLDLTVSTFATDASASSYDTWVSGTAFTVSEIIVANGGAGYDSNVANITVSIVGTTGSSAEAIVSSVDANGSITAISVFNSGSVYTTIPNVTITGANTSTATATAVLAQNTYDVFEYRIFKDMNDNYSYLRVNPSLHGTTLAENVTITSNTITVVDSSVLSDPAPYGTVPGVIYINGERITFWTKDDSTNTLSNIRRGTLGTGTKSHAVGDTVVDGASAQQVPYSDNYTVAGLTDLAVTTSGEAYQFIPSEVYIRSNIWYSAGFVPTAIVAEPFVANTVANIVSTEANISITTEGSALSGTPSATDGTGLFNSSRIQAIFIRDEI